MFSRTPARGKGGQRESERITMNTIEERKMFLKALNNGRTDKIVLKNGSSKLYFDFQYNGRIEKASGLAFSVDNAIKARTILDEMVLEIQAGNFCFSSRFPEASLVSKTLHIQQERNITKKRPDQITIKEFVYGCHGFDGWISANLPTFSAEVQKRYLADTEYWIIPLYGDLTFSELTGDILHQSLSQLTYKKSDKKLMSGKRKRNILTPLSRIWKCARSKYSWRDLDDPFQYLEDNTYLPRIIEKPTRMLLPSELFKLLKHMDIYNRNIAVLMALTGMIASEILGLRKEDIRLKVSKPIIKICNKIVGENESKNLKTDYRPRNLNITKNIKEKLDYFLSESPDEYVFTKPDGTRYSHDNFREAWELAFVKAELEYVRPYSLRHCFAGWSKFVNIQLSWLQSMMGHGSLEMLYTRYGHHVDGLEDERESIIEFFGLDYLRLGKAPMATTIAKVAKARQNASKPANKKAA
jgi:integrase